jgi:hypothetical protein
MGRGRQNVSDINGKGENIMKFSPPKVITWWIAVILGILALIGSLGVVPALAAYAFWLAFIGLALLAIACITKGL